MPFRNTILLVDDTPENLKVLSGILEKKGYKLRFATDGEQAVESVKAEQPDLILMDIMMPKMDGYEACIKIKNDVNDDIPVIFLSALSDASDKVKAFEVGGVDYIEKPFHAVEIIARVNTHLEMYHNRKKLQDGARRLEKAGRLGVWEWDLETGVSYWEDSMYRLFNIEINKDLDTDLLWRKHVHPEDSEETIKIFHKSVTQKTLLDTTYRIIDGTGNVKYLSSNATLEFNEKGEPIKMLGINMDVTKEMEVTENLKSSNKKLENFAYLASHDLQEPLRVITSYLQIIKDNYNEGISERALQLMERVIGASDRMKQLINGLLEFSRINHNNNTHQEIDFNQLLQEVIEGLKFLIREKNAEVIVEGHGKVFGDKNQMLQVFSNLINNGIKYHKDNQKPIVKININDDETKNIIIAIQDNGIGIKPEYHNRVFQIFQRLHTREEYNGTGIGLAIVKKIIEHHNGTINIDINYNKGTQFNIVLPKKMHYEKFH